MHRRRGKLPSIPSHPFVVVVAAFFLKPPDVGRAFLSFEDASLFSLFCPIFRHTRLSGVPAVLGAKPATSFPVALHLLPPSHSRVEFPLSFFSFPCLYFFPCGLAPQPLRHGRAASLPSLSLSLFRFLLERRSSWLSYPLFLSRFAATSTSRSALTPLCSVLRASPESLRFPCPRIVFPTSVRTFTATLYLAFPLVVMPLVGVHTHTHMYIHTRMRTLSMRAAQLHELHPCFALPLFLRSVIFFGLSSCSFILHRFFPLAFFPQTQSPHRARRTAWRPRPVFSSALPLSP